ncbi:MAG: agmatine deiminase family protein [Candidatus Binatia bacterium]|nr:agmatine deiminase family protein [Candidatus Binatia bacterium]
MPQTLPATPAELGYCMPAEWEPHEATWLSWPHKEESWPGLFESVPPVWAEIVRALVPFEEVRILVGTEELEESARSVLERARVPCGRVRFFRIPTNDAWARDHGPIFVVNRQQRRLAIVDWEYNAWGGKYPPWDLDNAVPTRVAEALELPLARPTMVLEGGSIDVNGCGSLLTTEACLLNPNRNPGLSREAIERRLCQYLGVRHILWLGQGIAGDDTDGHVDDLARFVGPRRVVAVATEDRSSPDYHALADNLRRLEHMRDQDGRPLEIVRLPLPEPVFYEGQQLPASYANFYIANGTVLVPTFGVPQDDEALSILQSVFPERRVVGIHARELIWGLGAIHCVTQQQPRV